MVRYLKVFVPSLLAIVLSTACAAQKSDPTVYVTEKGKKYHTKNCRLKHGSTGIGLSQAKKQGYSACAVCKPPK